jgi:hypothetical protein
MEINLWPGDIIAVHINDVLSFHARVEEILPDVKRGWRRMRFLALSIPRREITWILEPAQLNGDQFEMGGTPVRIERLPDPEPTEPVYTPTSEEPLPTEPKGKVISFPPPKAKR